MNPNHPQSLLQRQAAFSRRNFLRGVGACIALPAFESFVPSRAFAAGIAQSSAAAASAPVRSAFLYFPNGAIPASWWPDKEGTDFTLSPTLEPLGEMRKHVQILGGLDDHPADAGGDGGGDHARANGTFLTGTRLKKSDSDLHNGVSIDQLMGQQIGHLTRFPSLEIASDPIKKSGNCDSNYACAYQFNISWSSPTTPVAPEGNPRLLFERLFGSGTQGSRTADLLRRQQQQSSILDFIRADANSMQNRLNARDRDKLDQYLTGVRELETRIQNAERFGAPKDPAVETPAGVPVAYEEYVQIMFDMLVLAFQTDSTRVVSFMLAHDGSNRSFGDIGIPEGHHDLSHHQNKEELVAKVATIDRWYITQLTKFLQKMEATPDADGQSLLHNSMIVYGSGCADGNRHTHANLPVLLAGGGGGTLTPGRHVNVGNQPLTNLYLSMADRMGLTNLDRFGDSTGRLSAI
jgi:hypothetical protein